MRRSDWICQNKLTRSERPSDKPSLVTLDRPVLAVLMASSGEALIAHTCHGEELSYWCWLLSVLY